VNSVDGEPLAVSPDYPFPTSCGTHWKAASELSEPRPVHLAAVPGQGQAHAELDPVRY
jgi:hypothetical protein